MTDSFLSRRRFLGGAAVVLPLPSFLSWVRPGEARAAAWRKPAEPIRRLLVYHVPNGFRRSEFTPRGEGTSFQLSPTLAPLRDFRKDILVPRGLANTAAVPIPQGGSHAVGVSALLTCTYPLKDKIRVSRSFDQVVARFLEGRTRLPSAQFGIDAAEGSPEAGWPVVYARTLAWDGPSNPLPHNISPARAFEQMFMGFDPRASRTDIERRRARRASVLDTVAVRAKALHAELGAEDRPKLDEYMTSVRDLERRIHGFRIDGRKPMLAQGAGSLSDETGELPTRVRHFHDLIVLAFKLDVTRVITFSHGHGLSHRRYPHLGVDSGHSVTHHRNKPDNIEKVKKLDLWRMGLLADLLRALKGARDPNGRTLLEESAVLYMSEIGDGNDHDQRDKPMVIAGQLGGAIRTGRVLYTQRPTGPDDTFADCSEQSRTVREPFPKGCTAAPQLADVYLGLLRAFGIGAKTFGETGTQPIDLA